MIRKVSFQEYFELLQALDGYTAKEAAEIVRKEYKKQWGIEPEAHYKYLDKVWKDPRAANKYDL